MKKVGTIIAIVLSVCVVLYLGSLGVRFANDDLFGVRGISIQKSITGEAMLTIDYSGTYGYSITPMDESEPLIKGEREVVVEDFGTNRVAVEFSDTAFASSLRERYPLGQMHELEDVPSEYEGDFHVWLACHSGHFVVVYIGTDEPITFEGVNFRQTSMGTVHIPL